MRAWKYPNRVAVPRCKIRELEETNERLRTDNNMLRENLDGMRAIKADAIVLAHGCPEHPSYRGIMKPRTKICLCPVVFRAAEALRAKGMFKTLSRRKKLELDKPMSFLASR